MATPIPENQAAFTVDEIVRATGAELVSSGRSDDVVGVVTDSRGAGEGSLFVALRGAQHDGHDHVAAAVEAGARAVIVDRVIDAPGATVLHVADTLEALGALAAHHRARLEVPFVAITGSVGKTSTKELVAAALRGAGHRPLATRGNLNNRVGVPMTLLTLDGTHDVAVIEIGMSVPGEIERLARIAQPTVGVVTAIEAVHTEGVGSVDGVLREKGALLEALDSEGVAIFRDRDAGLAPRAPGRTLRFGRTHDADVRLAAVSLDAEALVTRATIEVEGRSVEIALPLLGEAAALNAAAALAVVHAIFPTSVEAAARALSDVARVEGRMSPTPVEGGALVIDDTYNASPASTRAALSAARQIADARGGRVICVLGDMLELGHSGSRDQPTGRRRLVGTGVGA